MAILRKLIRFGLRFFEFLFLSGILFLILNYLIGSHSDSYLSSPISLFIPIFLSAILIFLSLIFPHNKFIKTVIKSGLIIGEFFVFFVIFVLVQGYSFRFLFCKSIVHPVCPDYLLKLPWFIFHLIPLIFSLLLIYLLHFRKKS